MRIDGKSYELKSSDEFAELTFQQQNVSYARLGALLQKANRTAADNRELTKQLAAFIDAVLIAPAAVKARLSNLHRVQLVEAYFVHALKLVPTKKQGAKKKPTAKRPATASAGSGKSPN